MSLTNCLCVSLSLYISFSLSLSVCVFVSLCLCVSLSHCLSVSMSLLVSLETTSLAALPVSMSSDDLMPPSHWFQVDVRRDQRHATYQGSHVPRRHAVVRVPARAKHIAVALHQRSVGLVRYAACLHVDDAHVAEAEQTAGGRHESSVARRSSASPAARRRV